MALTYIIDSIEYQGGSSPHFAVGCTVTADTHTATTVVVLNDVAGKTLAELKAELDQHILTLATKIRDAWTIEQQMSQYIGQEFTVG